MPKFYFIFILTGLLTPIIFGNVSAQVCNCSSAPLIENQRFVPLQSDELRMGVSHEYHELWVQSDSDPTIPTPLPKAYLHRTLLELQYALNRNWSILVSLPFIVSHIESPKVQNQSRNHDIGMLSIITSYQLMSIGAPLSFLWTLGPGIHLPTGSSIISSANEPSYTRIAVHTGSWAYSIWTQIASSFDLKIPLFEQQNDV